MRSSWPTPLETPLKVVTARDAAQALGKACTRGAGETTGVTRTRPRSPRVRPIACDVPLHREQRCAARQSAPRRRHAPTGPVHRTGPWGKPDGRRRPGVRSPGHRGRPKRGRSRVARSPRRQLSACGLGPPRVGVHEGQTLEPLPTATRARIARFMAPDSLLVAQV